MEEKERKRREIRNKRERKNVIRKKEGAIGKEKMKRQEKGSE